MAPGLQWNQMRCHEDPRKSQILIHAKWIQPRASPYTKGIGVLMSDSLKRVYHIQEIAKKANQRIRITKKCLSGLKQTKVTTLYQAIVRPILKYAGPVWNPKLVKDIKSLDKVHDRCAKLTSPPLTFQELADRRWQADMYEAQQKG